MQFARDIEQFSYRHRLTHDEMEYPIHIHDRYEIYYFVSGDINFYIEGNHYSLQPGDLLIINGNELHVPRFNPVNYNERYIIEFSPDFIKNFQAEGYDLLRSFEQRIPGSYNKIDKKYVEKYGLRETIIGLIA